MSQYPLDPDPQYNPDQLADLTAATDANSQIPKLFGYLSGSYATATEPEVPGDVIGQIDDEGYFGPALPGTVMPPFPPVVHPVGATIAKNQNYGQPSIKNNATPGSLILSFSVSHDATPSAFYVEETGQAVPGDLTPPFLDEVITRPMPLPT